MGIGWYRKHFNVPESYRDQKVSIEFEGVYQLSDVWINGQHLGQRPNGFIGFSYDLTPHLKYGGDNVVAVKADNSHQPNCRWYTGSGIYRHTWLVVTGPVHVAYCGTFITTPKVEMDVATVQVQTRVQNEGASPVECRVTSTIMDRDGNVAEGAQPSEARTIAANGEYEFTQQIRVDQPNLWSLENPYLYTLRTSMMTEARGGDSYDTRFGIRKIEFDVDRGFLLNGRHVKLNGFYGHEDGGCMGNAVPKRVWQRRLEILKEMGCNSVRTGHNPWAPDILDVCDELGFMVMNEMFDEWKQSKMRYGYGQYFDEWSERDVTAFVRRDRNHPSVLLWSAGNEIGEQASINGVEMVKRLVGIFHKEDPTRPVTMGCDRIAANLTGREVGTPPEFCEVLDVVGYNYFDRRNKRAETYATDDRHAFPKRKFIGTENIGLAGTRGEYFGLFPPQPGVQAWGIDANRGTDVESLWKWIRLNDYVTGDHSGSGIDYLAETQWPRICPPVGSLDTAGFIKDAYYFYQSQWTNKTVLHIFPHWNWKGKEGEIIPVICYTNCDTVELFLNGKSYGVQGYWFPRVSTWPERRGEGGRNDAVRTTSDLHLTWPLPYQPGTLKAVGTKGGKVVAEVEVTTTGEAASIELSADREVIAADRRDVAHFTAKILDAPGRVVPGADNEIAFEIQGEGKLVGLDSGNPLSHENYKASRRKAFHGLCLAIVQSTAKPGRIQLTATSPGLKSGSAAVITRA
jgi:beta-galactosidase